VSQAPVTATADEFVNILTGGTSGVYYLLGVAITRLDPSRKFVACGSRYASIGKNRDEGVSNGTWHGKNADQQTIGTRGASATGVPQSRPVYSYGR
jgi:hypothetical protein